MDTQVSTMHPIRLMAGYTRLLAGLMWTVPDRQDVDRGTFALVLQEIAAEFARVAHTTEARRINCPHKDGEGRP